MWYHNSFKPIQIGFEHYLVLPPWAKPVDHLNLEKSHLYWFYPKRFTPVCQNLQKMTNQMVHKLLYLPNLEIFHDLPECPCEPPEPPLSDSRGSCNFSLCWMKMHLNTNYKREKFYNHNFSFKINLLYKLHARNWRFLLSQFSGLQKILVKKKGPVLVF